ncbi:hypothetical protein, partial [Photobacterium sanguinicancri]|uniref:hypothetical protein n=1 Tax=Photobacterium sanguinicancri TaxID=875932 RepID=UPI0026E42966
KFSVGAPYAKALPDLVEFFLLTLLRSRCELVNSRQIRMQLELYVVHSGFLFLNVSTTCVNVRW